MGKPVIRSKTKKGDYGLKAYGTWFCFSNESDFMEYLMEIGRAHV